MHLISSENHLAHPNINVYIKIAANVTSSKGRCSNMCAVALDVLSQGHYSPARRCGAETSSGPGSELRRCDFARAKAPGEETGIPGSLSVGKQGRIK